MQQQYQLLLNNHRKKTFSASVVVSVFDEIKLVGAMTKQGLNLTKLSQESGVSRQTLSMMKAGKVVDGTGQEYKRIRLYVW